MKNFTTRAFACAAALVAASSAYAAPLPSEGHYEWRTSGQQRPGIRAPLLAPERVLVATRQDEPGERLHPHDDERQRRLRSVVHGALRFLIPSRR